MHHFFWETFHWCSHHHHPFLGWRKAILVPSLAVNQKVTAHRQNSRYTISWSIALCRGLKPTRQLVLLRWDPDLQPGSCSSKDPSRWLSILTARERITIRGPCSKYLSIFQILKTHSFLLWIENTEELQVTSAIWHSASSLELFFDRVLHIVVWKYLEKEDID